MDPSELLVRLSIAVEALQVRYLVTGSMATIFFGEPRFTNDIDVVIDLPLNRAAEFCAHFPPPEYYVDEVAVREAIIRREQFNIIHPESGLKIDVMIPDDSPFNRCRFGRVVAGHVREDLAIRFASPEDVIIKKLEYYQQGGSDKHVRDITGVLRIMGAKVDRPYIDDWAVRLGLAETWREILGRLDPCEDDVPER